jgi:predicted adenylyl cyclase CyaB
MREMRTARNVEIKARLRDPEEQVRLARNLADGSPEELLQEDIFFNVPAGRLKLRLFEDGSGELIQYDRPDSNGPKESQYVIYPTRNPVVLRQALAGALGIRGIVRKKRTVYHSGQTRIHFDQVETLGHFIELEVVLRAGEDVSDGATIAEDLMRTLRIDPQDLVAAAYIDLIGQVETT